MYIPKVNVITLQDTKRSNYKENFTDMDYY